MPSPLHRVAAIKIDVEGHEYAVLGGAFETLARDKPLCIVECEERHNEGGVARVFSFVGLGYRPYFLREGKLREGAEFDAASLQMAENAKLWDGGRSRDYINNFIFAHPDNAAGLKKIRQHYAKVRSPFSVSLVTFSLV